MGVWNQYPNFENLVMNHWDQVVTLMPDFTTQKPVESHFKLSIAFDKEKPEELSVDLEKWSIKTDSREFLFRGYMGTRQTPFMEFQVSNYKPLMKDLATYYNQWQSVLSKTQSYEMPPLNDKVLNRVTAFLEELSSKKTPDGLHIVIQGLTKQDMVIGPYEFSAFESATTRLITDIIPELYPVSTQ